LRGRKRKPIEQQIAEGDPAKRGVHKLDRKLAAAPKASSGLPDCPKHLSGLARYAWEFWSEELAIMKLDKRPDGPLLEGACQQYARAVTADAIVEKEGIICIDSFVTKLGDIIPLRTKKHPAVEISSQSWGHVKSFCSEFGFSPASRVRLTLDDPTKGKSADDDLLKALSQPRTKPEGSSLVQ